MNRRDFLGWLGVSAAGVLVPMRRPFIFDLNPGNKLVVPATGGIPAGRLLSHGAVRFDGVPSGFLADGMAVFSPHASYRLGFDQLLNTNGSDVEVTWGGDGFEIIGNPSVFHFELTGRWQEEP